MLSGDNLKVVCTNTGRSLETVHLFISVMTDLELPDLGHDLIGIDLEKGIFKVRGLDNESSDSGNNSMNTNGSGWCLDYRLTPRVKSSLHWHWVVGSR
jgi:hypothetical protein